MKVTEKMSLKEYDIYCREKLTRKIPNWKSKEWTAKIGDCIYDYSKSDNPILRESVHDESRIEHDLSGENSLISNHFYYFGEEPVIIPKDLQEIIKIGQGYRKITENYLIIEFENWIKEFYINTLYAMPQLRYLFDNLLDDEIKKTCSQCSKNDLEDLE